MISIRKNLLKRIHVNQHVIKANRKNGTNVAPLTVKSSKGNDYGHTVVISRGGQELARVVYQPENPLSCGAHVWIETKEQVDILQEQE